MGRPVTYSIIDCPDGRFVVLAISPAGSAYRRGPLLTLAEAETCVEELRALMGLCGAPIVRRRGEILGLIGPNGSGKTTFFNVVTGIYPASAGRIAFDQRRQRDAA